MKKLLLPLLLSVQAFAMQVGNPIGASIVTQGAGLLNWCPDTLLFNGCLGFELGFYGDYIFDKKIKEDGFGENVMHETTMTTNGGYIALNFFDRVNLEAILGATQFCINEFVSASDVVIFNPGPEYASVTDFSWALGARGTIWECGCFGVGANVWYFATKPDLNYFNMNGSNPVRNPEGISWKYWEWQAALGIAYQLYFADTASIVPYAAVDYNNCKLSFDNATLSVTGAAPSITLVDKEKATNWGYALGLTLTGCDCFEVSLEGRFSNEKAVAFNTLFRF
ncbi:MAG: hypothetical protein ACKVOH_07045 [Chlamydiales bacterium]